MAQGTRRTPLWRNPGSWPLRWLVAVLLVTNSAAGARSDDAKPVSAPEACTLEPGPVKTVARVIDGETVALDDGSEVRLIGALAPRARDAGAAEGAWPAEQDAIAALNTLVLGRSVKLAYGGKRQDRYGRHLAHLFVAHDGASEWVQGAMLSEGHARAYGLDANFACARELLSHERFARDDRRGIWQVALYRPKPAPYAGELMKYRSGFHIVQGRVVSVSRTKSAVYLNFGSDWKTDFTARISKAALSADPEWSSKLETLKGKDISVRGWIERRNGPLIDVSDLSQIEIEGEAAGPPVAARPRGSDGSDSPAPANAPDSNGKRPEPEAPGAVKL